MPASWPVVRITPSPRMWPGATRVGWGVWAHQCGGNGSSIRVEDRGVGGALLGRIRAIVATPGAESAHRTAGAPSSGGGEVSFGAGRRRVYRPWIPEPGMWAQWDWGAGPVISGRRTNQVLCVAGVVEVPGGDRDLGPHPAHRSPVGSAALRRIGSPTTSARSRSITSLGSCAIRRSVAVGGHYGITVHAVCRRTRSPRAAARHASAKADLVPTDANLTTPVRAGRGL